MRMLWMMPQTAAGFTTLCHQSPALIGNLAVKKVGVVVGISAEQLAAQVCFWQQFPQHRCLASPQAAHLKILDNPGRIDDDVDAKATGKTVWDFSHGGVWIFGESAYHQRLAVGNQF